MEKLASEKKIELNYRKGGTAHSCSECNHYVHNFEGIGCKGEVLPPQPRCTIIGLKNGREYKINPNNICNSHNNSHRISQYRMDV
jgi:hypothetical protein